MDLPEQSPFKQKSGRKCLKGLWRWTCQRKFFLAEIRPKVLKRALAVDLPEQSPFKQKSGRKCLKGLWRWTCQSKPLFSRNQAEKVLKRALAVDLPEQKPFEAEISPKVLKRALAVDLPEQSPFKHFRPDFCLKGVCSGKSTAKALLSTFGLISASKGFALANPPPNPAETLSPWFLLPRLETSPSYLCFKPDYGLGLGLWILLFGASETDSGITD